MGLLDNLFKRGFIKYTESGNKYFNSKEYGLAKSDYEEALRRFDAAKDNPRDREELLVRLDETKNLLARNQLNRGLELLIGSNFDEAESLFSLALQTTKDEQTKNDIQDAMKQLRTQQKSVVAKIKTSIQDQLDRDGSRGIPSQFPGGDFLGDSEDDSEGEDEEAGAEDEQSDGEVHYSFARSVGCGSSCGSCGGGGSGGREGRGGEVAGKPGRKQGASSVSSSNQVKNRGLGAAKKVSHRDDEGDSSDGSNSSGGIDSLDCIDDEDGFGENAAFEIYLISLPDETQDLYRTLGDDFATGFIAIHEGEGEKAISLLEKALKVHPDTEEISLELGRAHLFCNHVEQAITHLERFYRKNPAHIDGTFSYAEALATGNRKAEAVSVMESLHKAHAGTAKVMKGLGDYYAINEQWERAIALYEDALKCEEISPTVNKAAVLNALGKAQLAAGHKEDSAHTLESLMKAYWRFDNDSGSLQFDREGAWILAGLYLDEGKKLDRALDLLHAIDHQSTGSEKLFVSVKLAQAYYAKGLTDEGQKFASRAKGLVASIEQKMKADAESKAKAKTKTKTKTEAEAEAEGKGGGEGEGETAAKEQLAKAKKLLESLPA